MIVTILILAGLMLGAIVGSFVATLCLRWASGRSALVGRSECDGCGRRLFASELIPLVSALRQRRRARCCGHPIDPLHWQVELTSAMVGGLSMLVGGLERGPYLALFGWLLLPLAVLDLRQFWLPDRLVMILAVAGLLLGGLLSQEPLAMRFLSGFAAFGLLLLVAVGYRKVRRREGLGAGDPKLYGAIGLWLGPSLSIATLLAAASMGLLEAILQRRQMEEARPLGTFLCAGAWIVAATATAQSCLSPICRPGSLG